jgi:FkbM family methyltransferase
MNYINRALVHLRNGTLIERLQQKSHEYIRNRRRMWWNSQIGKREYIETKIQSGVRMRLYFDSKLSQLIYSEDFEWQERQFINAFLRPGDVFVDVGANIGLFTLIAAKVVGNTGHVYTFEPCSKTYQRLLDNVQLNRLNNVSCYQLALSDEETETEMAILLEGFDAWNSLIKPVAIEQFAVERVNCKTWNKFTQENNLIGRVTMMKIDVEGWESHVLLGGENVFSRKDAPVLQVEFTEKASNSAGSSCEELYHLLEEFGYQMFIYDAKSKRLIPDPLRETYPYVNLIAIKRQEEISKRLKECFS